METLLAKVVYALVMFGSFMGIHGAIYSTKDSACRFSQCLVEKISNSSFFNSDDRSEIIDAGNVLNNAMENMDIGSRGPLALKILSVAFVASLADIIILENSERNFQRKRAYTLALNDCSMSAIGYIDTEFVYEALKIMSILEIDKTSVYDDPAVYDTSKDDFIADGIIISGSNPRDGTGVFNPSAVRHSPVQRTFIPGYVSNDKTVFDPSGSSSFGTHISSEVSNSNFRSVFPRQQSSKFYSSSNFGGTIVQTESHSGEVAAASDFPQEYREPLTESSQPFPSLDGKNLPQTKEGEIFSKYLAAAPDTAVNLPFQDPSMRKTEETAIRPSGEMTPSLAKIGSTMTPPPSFPFPDTPIQFSAPISSAIEGIIFEILTNSTSFRNAFISGMDRGNAFNIARVITQQSLSGYDSDIINEALDAVSSAVAEMTLSSPENFALTISSALASVLKQHNLPLFVEGSSIASSMLPNPKPDYDQQANFTKEVHDSSSDGGVLSSGEQPQLPFDFQSPVLVPEYVEGEIFSNALSQYLVGSSRMTKYFCENNSSPSYFILIKSALSEYGTQISSIAASKISSYLEDLSAESLCSGFARVISDTISEILTENGLLEAANAEEISKQIEFSAEIFQTATRDYEPETTLSGIDLPTRDNGSVADKIVPELQSSFSDMFSNVTDSTFNQPSVDYLPSIVVKKFTKSELSNSSAVVQNKYEDTEKEGQGFGLPVKEPSQEYEYYTIPGTPPLSPEISDLEFSTAVTLIDALTDIPEAPPTKCSSKTFATIKQDEIEAYLIGEMESVLEALNDKSGGQKQTTTMPGEVPIIVPSNFPSDIMEEPTNSSTGAPTLQPQEAARATNPSRNSRRWEKTTTPTPVSETSSSDEMGAEYVNSEVPVHQYQTQNFDRQQESSDVQEKDASTSLTSSEDSADKQNVRPMELQPRFQEPVYSDTPSPSRMLTQPSSDEGDVDASKIVARAVSQIASSSIHYIRSSRNFDIERLCRRLNQLAGIVNIPPLYNCGYIPLIDYLLNILMAVTRILRHA